MKIYNLAAYLTLIIYLAAGTFLFPLRGEPFFSFLSAAGYFLFVWLLMGIYLADVVHLGLAHRSLDVAPWFVSLTCLLANTLGIYINPTTWTNRHRLHHKFSDQPGDPNKLAADGFFKTCFLALFPYRSVAAVATDPVFRTWPLRLVSNPVFAVVSQFTSYGALWLVVREWRHALVLWAGMRLVAAYIQIVQNYWAHERCNGTRRYHDDGDNAMNLTEVLPVTLTFSACLQNNHHHSPRFVRLSHDPGQWDFGFQSVRLLHRLGLARPTREGRRIPEGATLEHLGLERVSGPLFPVRGGEG